MHRVGHRSGKQRHQKLATVVAAMTPGRAFSSPAFFSGKEST
jgi:hypothetical protein